MSVYPGIVCQHCFVVLVIECFNCRFASEFHVFTVTCDAIEETLRLCADFMTHISSPLEDCCFGSICCRVGHSDGDLAHIGNVIFGYDGVFILC